MKKSILVLWILVVFGACNSPNTIVNIPSPKLKTFTNDTLSLSKEAYYNKVLGALVGSAIGDAMGASTEMWDRNEIQLKYGYITGLTPAVRPQSPEGTWANNLLAGATTDDTRWKYVMVQYFKNNTEITPVSFTNFITSYYQELTKTLAKEALESTDDLDAQLEKLDWIKEWARVSMAYKKGATEYTAAQNRFYGGEMSCAGQLYSPMLGLIRNTPEEAYNLAYDLSLFDIGYAKDITASVAAMTQMAMRTQHMDSILNTITFTDPQEYQNSRLVGRIALNIADAAIKEVLLTEQNSKKGKLKRVTEIPENYPNDSLQWCKEKALQDYLDKNKKAISFHAGEVWEILITALKFGDGDFTKTMQFIVNYGRDNDTVAAIAGMILGAKIGYSDLPNSLKTEVLKVNKENLGLDLEQMAKDLTQMRYR